ncbi:unnamed protein product, partial [Colletotrichum noveboracense]
SYTHSNPKTQLHWFPGHQSQQAHAIAVQIDPRAAPLDRHWNGRAVHHRTTRQIASLCDMDVRIIANADLSGVIASSMFDMTYEGSHMKTPQDDTDEEGVLDSRVDAAWAGRQGSFTDEGCPRQGSRLAFLEERCMDKKNVDSAGIWKATVRSVAR